ncbi:CBS domain-containing protein [candidate division GN15 bacterium]|nr:CBS domain-containing protein [candidate division GN15 bacterium]
MVYIPLPMAHRLATRLIRTIQPSQNNLLIVLSVMVGLATGFGAMAFTALIEYFNELFFGLTDQILVTAVGFADWGGYKWWLPIIPMLGGLLVGPIVYKFASEARGHGVPEVMNAVARLGGIIRSRVAAAKAVASAICIGSGGSAGREGPIVQIGSAIGSVIGQIFRMGGNRVKVLVGCGAAAGISAVFNAPIAGVIFSLEVILGDFGIRTFAPVILSSVVASVVTRTFIGNSPAFEVPAYSLVSAWEIPMYAIMGVLLGALSVSFTRILDWTEDAFEKIKMTNWLKPAVGGLLLGVLAIFYPQVLADGYKTIRLTLHGDLAITLLLILVAAKMLATCMTLGSGNSGGIFAPSLFMGAVAGGSFGYVAHKLFPSATATPGAYALVGMAGMVAGATHAPITALLIIYEMTLDYRIILPLMVTVVFSVLIARWLYGESIYTIKLAKRGIEIRGGKDLSVLRAHTVSEVMETEFETVRAYSTVAEIFRKVEASTDSYFIVVDSDDHLKGVLSFQDLRNLLSEHSLDNWVIAQDLIGPYTVTLQTTDDLQIAQQQFSQRDYQLIPVVEPGNPFRVVGIVRREALIDYYNKSLLDTLRQ